MADHPEEPKAPRRPRQARTAGTDHNAGAKGRTGKAAGPRSQGGKAPAAKAPAAKSQGERIAKTLARAGVASRREVERLIGVGKVAVNGRILDTPATLVQPGDILTVDGKVVNGPESTRLWRYHKPAGLVTTHRDPQDRPTVFQSLPQQLPRVISVGRLDLNSEGLLLLTNDGELARALELPSNAWVRRYRARAFGRITQARLDTLKDGITVEGVDYGAIEARLDKVQIKPGQARDAPANVWITLALSEGKNREVRRVLEALGLKVNRLIRLAYGPFALATLEVGAVEEVGPRVIREQLSEFIAPESLPQGDRPAMPGPLRSSKLAAARRRAATFESVETVDPTPEAGQQGEGALRPKPEAARTPRQRPAGGASPPAGGARSRPRPGGARTDAGSAQDRPAYKAGWARPKPGPKPRGAKGPARAAAAGEGDAPPAVRGTYGKRPASEGGARGGGEASRTPPRGYGKRPAGRDDAAGGARGAYGKRPAGADRSAKAFGAPRGPRSDAGEARSPRDERHDGKPFRPKSAPRPGGDRARGPRPGGPPKGRPPRSGGGR